MADSKQPTATEKPGVATVGFALLISDILSGYQAQNQEIDAEMVGIAMANANECKEECEELAKKPKEVEKTLGCFALAERIIRPL